MFKASPSVRGQEKKTGRAPKPSTPRGKGSKKTPQQQEKEDKIVAKLLQEEGKFLDFSLVDFLFCPSFFLLSSCLLVGFLCLFG